MEAQVTVVDSATGCTERLVPITEAAGRLGRSVGTLKRMHRKGHLAVVIMQGQWFVPESFLSAVFTSPQPARAGAVEEVARKWFAAHAASEAVA